MNFNKAVCEGRYRSSMKQKAPFRDEVLFCIIFILTIYEQFNFGHPLLSLYKLIIFPLTLIACVYLPRPNLMSQRITVKFSILGIVLFFNLLMQYNYQAFIFPVSVILMGYYFSNYCYYFRIPTHFQWFVLLCAVPQLVLFLVTKKVYLPWAFDSLDTGRFKGFSADPNFMCFTLCASILAGSFILLGLKDSLCKNSLILILIRLFIISIVVIPSVYVIIESGSRTGVAFIFIIAFFVFGMSVGYVKASLLMSFSLIVIWSLLDSVLYQVVYSDTVNPLGRLLWRFKLLLMGNPNDAYVQDAFNDSRAYIWNRSIPYLVDGLFVGIGRLNFRNAIGKYSHNSYLDLMLDCGTILGAFFIIYVIIVITKNTWVFMKDSRKIDSEYHFFSIYCPLYCMGAFFFSMSMQKFTWIVVAFIFIIGRNLNKRNTLRRH